MAERSKRTGAPGTPEEGGDAVAQKAQKVRATESASRKKSIGFRSEEAGCQAVKSKIDRLIALLRRQKGVTVAQLAETLGWQQHSVRGAMSGALKKRGLSVVSEKTKGQRLYRLVG